MRNKFYYELNRGRIFTGSEVWFVDKLNNNIIRKGIFIGVIRCVGEDKKYEYRYKVFEGTMKILPSEQIFLNEEDARDSFFIKEGLKDVIDGVIWAIDEITLEKIKDEVKENAAILWLNKEENGNE